MPSSPRAAARALRGPPRSPREPRLLFVLAGQSNMAGRDRSPLAAAPPPPGDARVVAFAQRDERWGPARHPLHADKPEKAGVGPGLAFAHSVLAQLGGAGAAAGGGVGLVPCAFGGSELARWEAGGDLFTECVRRVRLCRTEAGRGSHLAGLLWHQGENDCGNAASAATYASRLGEALDALRRALGEETLPVVIGELGYWLDQADSDYVHAAAINAAIVSTPGRLSGCACVSAHGLAHKGDRLHFDAASQEEMGRRYAAAWLSLSSPPRERRPRGDCPRVQVHDGEEGGESYLLSPLKKEADDEVSDEAISSEALSAEVLSDVFSDTEAFSPPAQRRHARMHIDPQQQDDDDEEEEEEEAALQLAPRPFSFPAARDGAALCGAPATEAAVRD